MSIKVDAARSKRPASAVEHAPSRTSEKAKPSKARVDEMSTGRGSALRQRAARELGAPATLSQAARDDQPGRIIGPGDHGPLVDEWQKDLVKLGYLSAKDARDEKKFGEKTADATRAFKRDHGLQGEAVWNRAEREMEKALKHAHSQAVNKWHVPYIEQMHSKGTADDWNELSNCGPTSLAMIARAFGKDHGMNDGQLINHLSELNGHDPGGKTGYEIRDIANRHGTGLHASEPKNRPQLDWVREQLRAGKLIMAEGHRGVTLDAVHQRSTARGNHWIVVRGIDRDGNFLVNDPSTRCHKLTPAQLAKFFEKEDSHGWALAISPR